MENIFQTCILKMNIYDNVLDIILLSVILYHLVISPYTKVEESFNIQAIHDIINYGILSDALVTNYDHVKFPGPVPRTFIGSIIIAYPVRLARNIGEWIGVIRSDSFNGSQISIQLFVRGILGLANGLLIIGLRNTFNEITVRNKAAKYRNINGILFILLTISQFHWLYYASRTLPNFIALPFVNVAFSKILKGNTSGLILFGFAGIVFRMEIGLLGTIIAVVSSLGFRQSNLFKNIVLLALGTTIGLVSSFCIDSYFWGYPVIPELSSFKFNIVDGKSADWGTEPWIAYFKKYLPQLFRPPTVLGLLPFGIRHDPSNLDVANPKLTDTKKENNASKNSLRILFTSAILFLIAISFQPHKEWRFIIYSVPIFTLVAANGFRFLIARCSFSKVYQVISLVVAFNVLIGIFLSLLMGYFSSYNYPGGLAISMANDLALSSDKNPVIIYMDSGSCMNGITRFGEFHGHSISYDKTEEKELLPSILSKADILIVSENSDIVESLIDEDQWAIEFKSPKFAGVKLRNILSPPFIMVLRKEMHNKTLHEFICQVLKYVTEIKLNDIADKFRSLILLEDSVNIYRRK